MALVVSPQSFAFAPLSGTGPRSRLENFTVPVAVSTATAILTGFIAEFSQGNDHHLGQLDIQVQTGQFTGPTTSIPVRITFGLRDFSGFFDDQYDGTVFFTIVGES